MQKLYPLLLLLPVWGAAQTERVAVNPEKPKTEQVSQWKPIIMKPASDSLALRYNSDSVSTGHLLKGQFKQIIILRFKYHTDLLEGIQKAVEQERIQNAVILNGVGSLTRYHVHAVSNNSFPSKNKYFEKEEPIDIININGFVIDGRVHAHITLATEGGAKGGHLEPNSKVFTFAALSLGVLDPETRLTHADNKNWR